MKKRLLNLFTSLMVVLSMSALNSFASDTAGNESGSFFTKFIDVIKTVFVYLKGLIKEVPTMYLILAGVALAGLIILIILLLSARRNVNELKHSQIDSLTGLGNIKYIRSCYNQSLDVSRKEFCFCYIGFDAASVKDLFGKERMDEIQQFAAKIISDGCGPYDYLARVADGDFVYCFRVVDSNAKQKISFLIDRLNKYQSDLLGAVFSSFRAGVYSLSAEKEDFETVLKNARLGYYRAEETKVKYYICTRDMLLNESSRKRLRDKLSLAIDNNEFDAFLQLIYNTDEGKFVAAEVLSRWNSPTEGFKMPSAYIDDMRNTGVIVKFDYYMLEKACKLLSEWKGTEFNDLFLSCNVTRITISENDFLQNLHTIVSKYDFDHAKLGIEITEESLIDNQTEAYRNILDCKTAGFRIALDDFGAGHSSIGDLCDYPIDIIKVDREIVVKCTTDRGNALMQGLISLAKQLKVEIICEGVENSTQQQSVVMSGCHLIQGYLYSYVMPVEEAKKRYLDPSIDDNDDDFEE